MNSSVINVIRNIMTKIRRTQIYCERTFFLDKAINFNQIVHTYTFQHCLGTGMRNGDETSPSISLVGPGQLVK